MSKVIIGNKSTIGIETDNLRNGCLSNVRLWIGNKAIGSFEESQSLKVLSSQLKHVIESRSNLIDDELASKGAEDLLLHFDSNGRFLLALGECFDDFHICAAKNSENIVFVWQLHRDHFFEYEGCGYEPNKALVKLHDLTLILKEM